MTQQDALKEQMDRAYGQWQRRWESAPEPAPERVNRYAIVFDCDPDEFESIRSSLRGHKLSNKQCRFVPKGWRIGETL